MTMGTAYRINIVCSGNICRSPMGEVVLRDALERAGLADRVRVESSGTGDWHVGEPADPRTVDALAARGYDGSDHRASWLDPQDLEAFDLVLVADRGHLAHVTRAAGQHGAEVDVRLLRSFDPTAVADDTLEVDDPYYGGLDGFTRVLQEIERACAGVTDHLRAELDG